MRRTCSECSSDNDGTFPFPYMSRAHSPPPRARRPPSAPPPSPPSPPYLHLLHLLDSPPRWVWALELLRISARARRASRAAKTNLEHQIRFAAGQLSSRGGESLRFRRRRITCYKFGQRFEVLAGVHCPRRSTVEDFDRHLNSTQPNWWLYSPEYIF